MKAILCAVALTAAVAAPVWSQGLAEVEVDGNEIRAKIDLAGGIGADLEIEFESVVGLATVESLGLSAELVDPVSAELLSRLPGAGLVSLPAGFPLKLTVEPPAAGGLAFSGVVTIELHTHNLTYTASSPLRLFSAPLGGGFKDITTGAGSGSYRVRGSQGGFSEFLILADLRPLATAVGAKFDRLSAILTDNADVIDGDVGAELWGLLDAATLSWTSGDPLAAIEQLEELIDVVEGRSGCGLPNVWRSSRDLVNVAGQLRSTGSTLIFSLRQESAQGS